MEKIEHMRRMVIEGGLRLVREGLVARTWGNISLRVDSEHMLITPSGLAYQELEPEDIVLVNYHNSSHEGPVKPSSEKELHCEIYRTRKNIHAVIHTHQMNASTVAAARREVPPILDDMAQIIGPSVRVGICPSRHQKDGQKDSESAQGPHGSAHGQSWGRLRGTRFGRGLRGMPGIGKGLQGIHRGGIPGRSQKHQPV